MATRREHEARALNALAEAESYEARARTAPEKGGLFTISRGQYKASAARARRRARKEFAMARRLRNR